MIVNKSRLCFAVLLLFAIIFFVYEASLAVYLPYDDIYSLQLVKSSYWQIVNITAQDVHPPLYYILLRSFQLVVGKGVFPARCLSILGVLATLSLIRFPIRKLIGEKASFIFIILFLFFPATQNLAMDIRMYSWLSFFVLGVGVFVHRTFQRSQKFDYILTFLFSMCAIYTHNYGLLAVGSILLCLLIALLRTKRRVKPFVILVSCLFVAYLPWIGVLFIQMSTLSNDYWIHSISVNDVSLILNYFYSPKILEIPFVNFSKMQMFFVLVPIIGLHFIVVLFAYLKRKDWKQYDLMRLSFIVFFLPLLLALLFSILVFPILVPRYMLVVYSFFILGLTLCLCKLLLLGRAMKLISYLSIGLMIPLGCYRYWHNLETYRMMKLEYREMADFVKIGSENPIFVSNDKEAYTLAVMQYIVPEQRYCQWLNSGTYKYMNPFAWTKKKDMNDLPKQFTYSAFSHNSHRDIVNSALTQLMSRYEIIDTLQTTDYMLFNLKQKEQ